MRKDNLLELIQSLGNNEKRYFKLSASALRGNSNIIRLFDVMCRMKEFKISMIEKEFRGEACVNQIPVLKTRLYEALLKSLRSYNNEKSIDHRLRAMVQDVQCLFDKRLYKQCEKILNKAFQTAVIHEKHLISLELLDWKDRVQRVLFYHKTESGEIDGLQTKYENTLAKIENERAYRTLESKLFYHYYKGGVENSAAENHTFHQILNAEIVQDEQKALTFKALCYYCNIHSQYNKISENWVKTYYYRSRLVDLIRSYTRLTLEDMDLHIEALNNMLPVGMQLKRYKEVAHYISLLRDVPKKYHRVKVSEDIKMRIFTRSYVAELNLYTTIGDVEKGLATVEKVKAGIVEHKNRLPKFQLLHLYYYMAYFYFSAEKPHEALIWVFEILNDKDLKQVENVNYLARILNLILHFELEEFELLEYIVRSTYRFLYNQNKIKKLESTFLSFMRKNAYVQSRKSYISAFTDLKKDIDQIQDDPQKNELISYLDLSNWLESRISQRPFYEVMKEKAFSR